MGNQASSKKKKIPKQGGVVGGSGSSKVPVTSEERRQILAARYEKGNSVDQLIASKRQEKARKAAADKQESSDAANWSEKDISDRSGLSGPPPSELVNPEVIAKLEQDKRALENSNFNFSETVISTSSAAKTTIRMDGFENTSASVQSSKESSEGNSSKEVGIVIQDFRAAVESCDQNLIREALQKVDQHGDDNTRQALGGEIEEAKELLMTLELSNSSNPEVAVDVEAFQSEIMHIVSAAKADPELVTSHVSTLRTLRTLFSNVISHPTETTYHRVKTSNKTIKTRLLDTASGSGERALKATGFVSVFDKDLSEQCLMVHSEAIGVMIDHSAELLKFLDDSIAQLQL